MKKAKWEGSLMLILWVYSLGTESNKFTLGIKMRLVLYIGSKNSLLIVGRGGGNLEQEGFLININTI